MGRLIDADALYNGAMKQEYFDYVEHDNHGRESFAYSCAMQRLADAPTIDAIPMKWIIAWSNKRYREIGRDVSITDMLEAWQREQEAR